MNGSGSGTASAVDKLNNVSVSLAAASIQASEDSKFDPKVQSGTPTVIRSGQGFCSPAADPASTLIMVGILLIVYGIIAK